MPKAEEQSDVVAFFYDLVLIVGVGPGLSASLARLCASKSLKIVLAARNIEKLEDKK